MSDVPLRIVMTNDVSDFVTGSTDAQKVVAELREAVRALGEVWQDTARKLTLRISLPITGLGIAATKVAADFESAMNRVEISTGAVGDQLKELSALAVSIGRDTTLGSTEAADAMDMLAKAGMQADTILRGGAAATVALAEATGSQLEPAAAAVTDIMAQFGKTASDLPDVVNRITGAVNESKLDFADFQLAMGQAGGVAGGLGVTFEDFATVLAATSSMFAS